MYIDNGHALCCTGGNSFALVATYATAVETTQTWDENDRGKMTMIEGSVMDLYYREVHNIIEDIHINEKERIFAAARAIANRVKQDKLVHIWGQGGHSNLAAMEIFFRPGGLMHVSAILNQDTIREVLYRGRMQIL